MLGLVGLNHKSAPVQVREKFFLTPTEITDLIMLIRTDHDFSGIVVLSTCNRTEIYFDQSKHCNQSKYHFILSKLCEFKHVKIEEVEKYFYIRTNDKCIRHLFRVSCGMDSLVIGEDQIISQVKDAFRISIQVQATSTILNRLFHKSFEVGKKVRHLTGINKGITSLSFAAVELASKLFSDFTQQSVLLVGTGDTGRLVPDALVSKGVKNIYITNRTDYKADELAKTYQTKTIDYSEFHNQLTDFDIIFTATSSQEPILSAKHFPVRLEKEITLFDLSMPRNIDKNVTKHKQVHLYNIDDLNEIVNQNIEKRKKEIGKSELIIDEALIEFKEWLNTLNLGPTIELLQEKFDRVVEARLDFMKKRVTEKELKLIAASSNYMKEKYLRLIINNLRIMSDNGTKTEYIDMVNKLLELTELHK